MSPVPPATSSSANGARRPAGGLSGRDQRVLPGAVQPARHQVVHQVVAARDAVEHVVDQRLLVVERHGLRKPKWVSRAGLRPSARHVAHGPSSRSGADHSARPACERRYAVRRPSSRTWMRRHARTARSRDRPPRPRSRPWRARASTKVEAQRGRTCAFRCPKDFAARLEGQTVDRARPARQISARRSLLRRRAAHASRHVGLVPRRAARRRGRRPATSITTRAKTARTTTSCSTCRRARRVTYNDPRRFGFMKLVPRAELDDEPLLRALGLEPLGNAFDAAMLARACRGQEDAASRRRCSTSGVVAGLGNIYVCEALHRARLSPKRSARRRSRRKAGAPNERAAAAGRRHQGGARRRDQGRRLVAARPSPAPTASSAISSTISASTTARASPARRRAAAASSSASCRPAARPSSARCARSERVASSSSE